MDELRCDIISPRPTLRRGSNEAPQDLVVSSPSKENIRFFISKWFVFFILNIGCDASDIVRSYDVH
jgi:hypothetical protein